MTPREELTELMVDKFEAPMASAEMISDTRREIDAELEQYAIGCWVPVSERPPEMTGKYLVRLHCKNIALIEVTETSPFFTDGIDQTEMTDESEWSHWLDLELPKEDV